MAHDNWNCFGVTSWASKVFQITDCDEKNFDPKIFFFLEYESVQ